MYPKLFFQNFWDSEQKNILFVCMPFSPEINEKFTIIKEIAKKIGLEDAVRVDEDWIADDITFKILDRIANSKMLLFDLSDDPKFSCDYLKRINDNVLYELGMASAIREPEDMILIREKKLNIQDVMPFDIKSLTINEYEKGEFKEFLEQKIKNAIEKQQWYKSKRIAKAAESIDSGGLKLMLFIYRERPEGKDHFNDDYFSPDFKQEAKLAILRLIDLGIITIKIEKNGREYAYHWTSFGKEVIRRLGIEKKQIN